MYFMTDFLGENKLYKYFLTKNIDSTTSNMWLTKQDCLPIFLTTFPSQIAKFSNRPGLFPKNELLTKTKYFLSHPTL